MSYYDTYLEFVQNYEELANKWKSLPKQSPHLLEKTKKFLLINQQLRNLNLEIEDFLVNIDQDEFNLSNDEQQRIENCMIVDRAIDRAKPFFILSMMAETWQDFNDTTLDYTSTVPTRITYPQLETNP